MRIQRVLPLLSALTILVVCGAIWSANMLVQRASQSYANAPQTTTSTPSAAAAAAATAAQQSSKPASGVAITKTAAVPACQTGALLKPQAVSLAATQTGLVRTPKSVGPYTIYGNTVSQITSQMYSCSPVVIGNEHFAGSTDYVMSWNYGIQGNAQNVCTLTDVRVGLAVSQTLPSWQPSATASASVKTQWQRFITNLTIHEDGHAQLDAQYAQTLATTLQTTPATDCNSITTVANARAQAVIAALDRANEAYDAQTGHGRTQGATLGQ